MEILIFILLAIVIITLLSAGIAGIIAAPYLPSFKKDIQRAIDLVGILDGQNIADFGCGDGRILIETAKKYSITAVGYEISVANVIISKLRAWKLNKKLKRDCITIKVKNFFKEDISSYDVIFCFLTPKAMEKLESIFTKQCKKGTKIVSFGFKLPHLKPIKVSRSTGKSIPIFLYQIG